MRTADKRHARGQTVRAKLGGHRQRAIIQQIDEVGVVAQVGIGLYGRGFDFGQGVNRSAGRHHHHVHVLPDVVAVALQLAQPIKRRERLRRIPFVRVGDHLPRHRMQIGGMRIEKFAYRGVTLGDPRPFIQQPRHLGERREVDFHQRGAQIAQRRGRLVKRLARRDIAEEFALRRPRHAATKVCAQRSGRRAVAARVNIAGIEAAHRLERPRCVFAGQRKHRHAIERAARRHHAPRADHATGRFQTDNVVKPRRHAARTRGVGTERNTRQAQSHCHRRTGTRSTGNVIGVKRIAARAVRRTRAHQPGGELIEIGFADEHRAGVEQTLHGVCGLRRLIGVRGTGRGGRATCDIDVVLDRKRHAVERQHLALGAARFEVAGARSERIGRHHMYKHRIAGELGQGCVNIAYHVARR